MRKADARDKVEGDLHELVHADNDRGEAQVDDTPHAARDGESADRAGRSAQLSHTLSLGQRSEGLLVVGAGGQWAVRAGSAAVDRVLDRLEQGRWRDGSNRAHPSAHLPDFPATSCPWKPWKPDLRPSWACFDSFQPCQLMPAHRSHQDADLPSAPFLSTLNHLLACTPARLHASPPARRAGVLTCSQTA